jgi:glyoxylase-like metal-dependent hydrolase (beta-lactamase superfamily II)
MGITLLDVENEIENIIGDPFCIDIIFITHSHFDHIDNLDLYDKPSIIISKLEYDITMDKSPNSVKEKLESNNVILVEDEYIFDDKFRFKVIGGHTLGSSVIYFEEGKQNYVITGDECYACDNISRNIPNGSCTDNQKNEKFISDTYNKGLIPLPYHDNKIFLKYTQISKNIVRII